MRITTRALAALSFALLTLSACSGGGPGGGDGAEGGRYGGQEQEQTQEETGASAAALTTAETDLGTIVVDGEGMTVYQFDQDEQGSGSSTCTGACLQNWPPVPGDGSVGTEGLTGEVGTITGTDGAPQLTLNGWPLYYFAGDEQPGDTTGQGVQDVWWVMTPAGEPIRG